MLKKSIFALLLCAVIALMIFPVSAQEPSAEETELANLITNADKKLDLNERDAAEAYLSQAREIISRNPSINKALQGHFNKVSGKLYMKSSLAEALRYFNLASSQFEGNETERVRVNFFIGVAYYYARDLATANAYFTETKQYFIAQGDQANLAQALNNLGVVAFERGDAETAISLCRQALAINNEIGNSLNASRNKYNLDYFSNPSLFSGDIDDQPVNHGGGGGGTSGSGTGVNTGGSGTVTTGGNGGGGFSNN